MDDGCVSKRVVRVSCARATRAPMPLLGRLSGAREASALIHGGAAHRRMPNAADGAYDALGGSGSTYSSRTFNGVVRCIAAVQSVECPGLKRIGLRSTITSFMIGAVVLSVLIMAVVKEAAPTPFQQLPASAHCADPQDVLTPSTGLCQATNTWALAFLRGSGLAACAEGLPGLAVLQAHRDSNGVFWYPYHERELVRQVYRSCTPLCATLDDTYHR